MLITKPQHNIPCKQNALPELFLLRCFHWTIEVFLFELPVKLGRLANYPLIISGKINMTRKPYFCNGMSRWRLWGSIL